MAMPNYCHLQKLYWRSMWSLIVCRSLKVHIVCSTCLLLMYTWDLSIRDLEMECVWIWCKVTNSAVYSLNSCFYYYWVVDFRATCVPEGATATTKAWYSTSSAAGPTGQSLHYYYRPSAVAGIPVFHHLINLMCSENWTGLGLLKKLMGFAWKKDRQSFM